MENGGYSAMAQKIIYVADDERNIRMFYERFLSGTYIVKSFPNAEGLLEAFAQEAPHLVVTDQNMGPGLTGDKLVCSLREQGYKGAVLMVSATIPKGIDYRTLEKPFDLRQLQDALKELL